ncbi:hypothetical protein TWF694_000488 [Orbilia ellipsospora]|uniref:amidase n=1 Tax=Orbilia ellipsospora TaxID=2528407 RepID=A0AAV9XNR0_9PEZI
MRLSTLSLVLLLDCVSHATSLKVQTGPWQDIALERQAHRDRSIAAVSPPIPSIKNASKLPLNVLNTARSMLTPRETKITEMGSMELLEEMANGGLTAVEVTNAFLRRAGVAQKLVNCVVELMPETALSRARFLDEYYRKNKKTIGPLHGLPISVKEHVGIKGLDQNAGVAGWVGNDAPDDAQTLKALYSAGGIFFARTTLPQTIMHLETRSNLFGTTVNPFNRNLTCGGSSGGEGALLGIRGSSLGVGTDIGGSIRSPSANNGIYGLKPTAHRLPLGGIMATMGGEEQIIPVIGPMSTTLEPLSLFMSVVLGSKPWLKDPRLIPFPWRTELNFENKKIKVGVMRWDGIVMPHPPVTRALEQVVAKLCEHKDKFEIIEWEETRAKKAWDIISSLYFGDGGAEEYAAMALTGEPVLPMSKWILTQPGVPAIPGHTISKVWNLTLEREIFRAQYAAKWIAADIDVLLMPVGPGVAPRLETAKYWGYTSLFNLLDYPAAVFPVDKVSEKDNGVWEYEPTGEKDKENAMLWDPDYYKDAPISLQLAGRRFDDEKVLEALAIMKKTIGLPFVDTTK